MSGRWPSMFTGRHPPCSHRLALQHRGKIGQTCIKTNYGRYALCSYTGSSNPKSSLVHLIQDHSAASPPSSSAARLSRIRCPSDLEYTSRSSSSPSGSRSRIALPSAPSRLGWTHSHSHRSSTQKRSRFKSHGSLLCQLHHCHNTKRGTHVPKGISTWAAMCSTPIIVNAQQVTMTIIFQPITSTRVNGRMKRKSVTVCLRWTPKMTGRGVCLDRQ